MKTGLALLLAAMAAGCSSAPRSTITLAPVGPLPEATAQADAGVLVVYSAYIPNEFGSNTPNYRRYHSAYKIFRPDGKLVRSVANESGPTSEEPTAVSLPPGEYRVEAMANGYGRVTVPVTVASGRPTIVHLDGPVDPGVK